MGEESLFVDEEFRGDSALGSCDVQEWRKPFKWIRAGKKLHPNATLFSVIQADNIKQGELGDCWLLAAIAVMADFPGHIMNLFENKDIPDDGRCVVRLFHIRDGWQDVVIDTLLPCDKYGTPLFAQLEGDSGSLWALLLEKAFAKFVGSYEGLIGGSTTWAWQVLTGQPWMARWTRKDAAWTRWEMCDIQDCFSREEDKGRKAAEQWRVEGMRGGRWKGPAETQNDDGMFEALASYTQAGYAISCSIGEGGSEEKRPDGLLAKHAYSVLQVLCAFGQRLVEVRNPWGKGGEWNGPWSDNSREWKDHPQITDDLRVVEADDGRFWMPWDAFAHVFGGHIVVCPVTLPVPMNSQLLDAESSRAVKKVKCPQCRQPYTKSWVMKMETRGKADQWIRLADGKTLCFLCLRATCRASEEYLLRLRIAPGIAGVHCQTKLALAPPKGPRKALLEECKYGAECYRRNPQHFYEFFHPSLMPPAPPCESGCGRSAASGFKTCCKKCISAPPNLKVSIPGEHAELSGLYTASATRREHGLPVWKQSGGRGWLWKGHVWMMALSEDKVGGTSGLIAEDTGDSMPVRSPHLVAHWQAAGRGGWNKLEGMKVDIDAAAAESPTHDDFCQTREERESRLRQKANDVLKKFPGEVKPVAA